MEAPSDLRDMVWASAELLLPQDGRVPALLPARYPETAVCDVANADNLKRGRTTQWAEQSPEVWCGLGQRVWTTNEGEHAIFDVRTIDMVLGEAAQDGA
jgi:type VI secretion system protein ImpE